MKKQTRKILNRIVLYFLSLIALISFSIIANINVILTFLLIAVFVYLKITEFRKIKKTNVVHLGFLFLIGLASAVFFERYTNLSPYYIPIPAISMLTVILFSSLELALLISLCLSVFVGFIFQGDLFLVSIIFLGSMTGAFFVYKISQRYKLVQAGIAVNLLMV